ncbi:hypothetical protein N7445_009258 [Penicillium cf. griseofulvum]|nr:hypothetical protein N7445_009258 [Penicillium cf. griseofulvum]
MGMFCSSKAAMPIALEALQQEVISFGVRGVDTFDGAQQDDPEKGAHVIVEVLGKEAKEVPFLLPIGPDVPEAEWQAHKKRVEQR